MGCARQAHDARDRTAYEESEAGLTTVGHKDAVLAEDEHRVRADDFARPLSDFGEHLVRRAVRTQGDHFAVPIGNDRASVREQPAGVGELEDVIARAGTVAVAGFRGQAEGCDSVRHALVRDDPDAGAIRDLDRDVASGFAVATAGDEGRRQEQNARTGEGILPLQIGPVRGSPAVSAHLGCKACLSCHPPSAARLPRPEPGSR